jgi:uncharacterized surface protein with fasciclin (FAS1) repeats
MNCIEETYSVATFENSDCDCVVVEGNLNFDEAKLIAQNLLKTNYGVYIIDEDVDNMEPIVLTFTKD